MFNFYLFNKSYEKADCALLEENLRILNDLVIVEREEEDFFWKNDSIWYCNTADGIFSDVVFSKIQDKQLSQHVIPRLFQVISSIPEEFLSLDEFDRSRFRIYNAFYGMIFDDPVSDRYITDKDTYSTFKTKYLFDVTHKSLWERRDLLFSRVILCPDVEKNLKTIGNAYLKQILKKLLTLDRYAIKEWTCGKFNYENANRHSSLTISPESKATMSQEKYKYIRSFKMPDGSIECFDLHIKTGDLRIYFYPKDERLYVGYIGTHLPTVMY
jgi:hypothetical protein